jgi:hypothetical protein
MLDRFWSNLTNGNRLATIGILFATFGFLSSWISVYSPLGSRAELSGWAFASLSPSIYFIILAGLAAGGLIYYTFQSGQLHILDTYGFIFLGILSLFILTTQLYTQIQSDAFYGLQIVYRPALWGVILGHTAILVGGYLNIRESAMTLPLN